MSDQKVNSVGDLKAGFILSAKSPVRLFSSNKPAMLSRCEYVCERLVHQLTVNTAIKICKLF